MARGPKEADRKFRTFTSDLEEVAKSAKNLDGIYTQLLMRSQKLSNVTEDTRDRFEEQLDIGKQIADNTKNIFNQELKGLGLADKIKEAKDKGRKDELAILRTLKLRVDQQRKLQAAGKKEVESFNERLGKIQKITGHIPIIGDTLNNAFSKAGEAYEKGIGEELSDSQARMKGLGTGAKVAGIAIALYIGKNILQSMQSMGVGLMDILSRPEFIFFGEESRAIADEFGNMNESGLELGLKMKMMAFFSGVTAENQAKILGMMAATSDASLLTLQSQMQSYKKAGVPYRAIMEDVANNTEFAAKFAKDGGANIFEAAKRAKELGINLSDVASISDSLLDFESSISKQMEASMLLGREINLDRARELAFTGDQVGLQEEVMRLVGSEAEFNKMNYLQREALGGAIGLNVERLGALVREEKSAANAAEQMKNKFIGIGAVIGALIGLILGGLAFFTGGVSLLGIAAMAGGATAGGLVGAGIGKIGASLAPGLQEGGIVRTPMTATVGERGPEAVVPLPRDGMKVDMAQTNLLLERLIRKVGDMGVSA